MPRGRRCRAPARRRSRGRRAGRTRPRACQPCASRWGPTVPSGSPAAPLRRGSTAAFQETLDSTLLD
uniref:Uncharacterized protein n=1 Tax=Arundo donax TaxID=35708 RepID=A0A0A9GET3_ARUDO